MSDADSFPFRARLATCIVLGLMVGLFGLVGRLVHIQTGLRARLLENARMQQQGELAIPARRGMILDARGRVVAVSRRMYDVFVDPSLAEDAEKLAEDLGARLGLAPQEILTTIHRRAGSRYALIARQVDDATAEAVRALRSPAVGLEGCDVRRYPLGASMAHLVGFVGADGKGLEGIERFHDEHLRGQDGRRVAVVDSRRRPIRPSSGPVIPPRDGGHVVLAVDALIQQIVEQELAETLAEFEAESAVGLVMEPGTGRVLAMGCQPSFDANLSASVPDELRRNRAVTDPVEPGSTFKVFVASGALEGGHIEPDELIDCHNGMYRFDGRVVRDVSSRGLLDLVGIFTYSSNIGIATVGQRMGNSALFETVRRFGFGEPTGIDFPGESGGVVRPLHRWGKLSAVSVSMGYEISVTPVQLLAAFSAVVNGGTMLCPRLVRELVSANGERVRADAPPPGRRVAAPDVADYLTRVVLRSVVESGTGKTAQVKGYGVVGKSGTAKLTFRDRSGYEPGAYSSAFLGAGPAHRPEVAVLVVVRRPNADIGYYGGKVAGPAVGRILRGTFEYLGVPREERILLSAWK